MTKLIKKVQLNTEQNDSLQSAGSTKGIVTNPFTEEEYEKMLQVQNWNGGYVDGKGFMPASSVKIYFPYYLSPNMSVEVFVALCRTIFDKDNMFTFICNAMHFSNKEEEFFHRYWYAEGNKELSSSEFDAIKSAVENLAPKSTQSVTIDNKTYVIKKYSLASHAIYGRALGTFSMYYEGSNAVGFKDIYDFNALQWGERELEAELLTRAMSVLGSLYGAADYSITFGIHN